MKTHIALTLAVLACLPVLSATVSLQTAPPVVVRTIPAAGATQVDPATTELRVVYSKPMQDGSWSWSTWGEENFPETAGAPHYLPDGRTCVLPVKLKPDKFYAIWLNSDKFHNFKDSEGRPAVPYLFTFCTGHAGEKLEAEAGERAGQPKPSAAAGIAHDALLNSDQRAVLNWTDRQFHSFFDARTFDGWSDTERAELEKRLLDTLKGPETREYYQAINTLAALRSTNALRALRDIAFSRLDKNNRDRWMSVRALGLMGDKASVPDLVHLVYHGNQNTHWWAQISLVRLTGQNFGPDWKAWGAWWNQQGGQPPYKPEIIRWWSGQPEEDKLAESLAESDRKFLKSVKGEKETTTSTKPALSAQLQQSIPVMASIKESWQDIYKAVQEQNTTNAVALLESIAPQIEQFQKQVQGAPIEPAVNQAIKELKRLHAALDKGDFSAAQQLLQSLGEQGQQIEEQIRTAIKPAQTP